MTNRERDPIEPGGADDPLRELAAAFRSLEPPDPTTSVESPDAATSAALNWLRAAWRASAPAAPPALPWGVRARLALRRGGPVVRAAAAAAALLAGAFFLARSLASRPEPAPTRIATQPSFLESDEAARSHAPEADDAAPRLVSLTADRMEMRSGPVRLILFTPSPESLR
jgi:hypothetical protein